MRSRFSGIANGLRALATGLALAAVAPIVLPRSLPVLPVVIVSCDDCGDIPWWLQAILTLVGIGIAMLILYVPFRLSRRIDNPRTRAIVRWGGVVILLIALVALARIAVLVLPDD
jgi:threonine/homoserine/homoserine lactone efflux protein